MTNSNMLEYLEKYVLDPVILTPENVQTVLSEPMPRDWQPLLKLSPSDRVPVMIRLWEHFNAEFQQVVNYFKQHLESIELLHSSNGLSMVYSVRAQSGEIMYYEGKPPVTHNPNPSIEAIWLKMPDALQRFYRELHNGWYYLASESMGLSSLQRMFILSREEWGILDSLGEPPVDMDNTLAIFTNGMGGYVCQEVTDDHIHTLLWFHNEAPRLNLELWPLVDSWTMIGFEG